MDEEREARRARTKMRAWGLLVVAAMFGVPGAAILWALSFVG